MQEIGLLLQGQDRGKGALRLLVQGLLRQQGARFLRQIADGKMSGPVDHPVIGGGDPGHDLQQGGLAGPVDPDQTDAVTGMDLDGDILEQMFVAVADIQMIN